MRLGILLCVAAATLVPAGENASAAMAPQNCRAHDAVARAICGSPEYLAMDREISALTDRAMSEFGKDDQRRLAQSELRYFHQRRGCGWASHNSAHPGTAVDECLRASMEGRVRALRSLVDRGHF